MNNYTKQLISIAFMALTAAPAFASHATETQDSISLPDIVVTGARGTTDVRHLPMTVTVLDRNVLTLKQNSNILSTIAEQVPGLMVTSRGMMGYGISRGAAGDISMRGVSSSTGQFMVLIDGMPQYNGVYGHSIADSYQTMMAEKVEILRGPASMLYGSNAMGGVLNIVTRQQQDDGCRTTVNLSGGSWGTVQAEASNQYRTGRFTTTVAAQYGRSDNHRANMSFEQFGGMIKLGYDINQNWNVSGMLDLIHFNASNPGPVSTPKSENDQWITRGAANIVVSNHFSTTSGALTIYDNFGFHKINDGYNTIGGTPQTDLFRSKDAVAGASWYQTATFFNQNPLILTAGIDYQHIYGRTYYTDRKTGKMVKTEKRLMQSAHAHENEVAEYLQVRKEFGRFLTIDLGIRHDWHSTAGTEWVPQLGFALRPSSNSTFKASMSKGFRNPSTKEMYLYGTANSETLHAESMWNYEVAWRQTLANDAVAYGINLFLIDGDNMIQTVGGKNINTGTFLNKGIEADLRWNATAHLSFSTNHSYLHMNTPVVAAPVYKGYLDATYTCGKWKATIGTMHVGNLYTAVGTDEHKNSFTLLNAIIRHQLLPYMMVYVKGDNLLAQDYEINLGYPMPRATFMVGAEIKFGK